MIWVWERDNDAQWVPTVYVCVCTLYMHANRYIPMVLPLGKLSIMGLSASDWRGWAEAQITITAKEVFWVEHGWMIGVISYMITQQHDRVFSVGHMSMDRWISQCGIKQVWRQKESTIVMNIYTILVLMEANEHLAKMYRNVQNEYKADERTSPSFLLWHWMFSAYI